LRPTSIAIVTALLASGASAATFHVDSDASLYSSAPGTVVTVTVTLTTLEETLEAFSFLAIQVAWDPNVAKVAGSNPPSTYGKSAQSQILPGVFGSLTPTCASAGPTKGRVCTVITQSNASAGPIALAPGQVVIGTLLLEVLGGAPSGTSLGLGIGLYNNGGITDPAADPGFTLGANFASAQVHAPEPTTATLLAIGLVGLGLARRRHTPLE
jgi:hypothetical protein